MPSKKRTRIPPKARLEIFDTRNGQFCFRFIKNGREMFRGSETYTRKSSVKKAIRSIGKSGEPVVVDVTKSKRK